MDIKDLTPFIDRDTRFLASLLMRRLLMPALLLALIPARAVAASEKPTYRELAEFYAPVIFQDAHSEYLDYITRFDFDGDWNGANNWANAYLFELPAYVYYAVIESDYHYFITYAFFHPRDYTGQPMEGFAPKTEHENDLEGCTLLVEKDLSHWGTPLLLQTLAHDKFFRYASSSTDRVHAGMAELNGSLVFMETDSDGRQKAPAVFVEAEGHGVKAASSVVLREGYEHPGIVYRFADRGAEVPQNNRDKDVSYELVPIEDTLWARRYEIGSNATYCCGDSFLLSGGRIDAWGDSFNGPIGGCAARPPWSWDEADDGPVAKGDWFRNPIHSYSEQLRINGLAGEYLHNPYLDPAELAPTSIPLCQQSRESTTLSEAVTGTLLGVARILFSGGLKKDEIGKRAGNLFLTNTVLLEWAGKSGLQNWSWIQTGPVEFLPSFSLDNRVELLRIPVIRAPELISPAFNAPARYFDRLVIRYRAREVVRGKLFWQYENSTDFEETCSAALEFRKSKVWIAERFDLSHLEGWDADRNVIRIKLDLLEPDGREDAETDNLTERADHETFPLEIHYLIFDREAFADTFSR